MTKVVKGFPAYSVTDTGVITNIKTGKVLSQYKNNKGYLMVGLFLDKKEYKKTTHRIVAETFLSLNEQKPYVDHIDMDKTNNNVDNLRWCTMEENNTFAFEIMCADNRLIHNPVNVNGMIFPSINKAAKYIAGIENKNWQTLATDIRKTLFKTNRPSMTRYSTYTITKQSE